MTLTPLEIQKMRFPQRMRGLDPGAVEEFLALVADDLVARLGEIDRLERENYHLRQRLEECDRREQEVQENLLRAQKIAEEINGSAHREAQLTIKEAEMTADRIVQQAIDQATRLEGKIAELRTSRRELQIELRGYLERLRGFLEADVEDERDTATVRTLARTRGEES